jgi:pyridoxine kinase
MKRQAAKPSVVVISSHVARGGVGNRSAVFALERLGFTVIAVPTVVLPFHPGHGPGTRIVPEDAAFAGLLRDLAGAPRIGQVGGILSGYLGAPAQAKPVADLVGAVKAANPDAVYLCDPVMGDAKGAYVPAATIAAIGEWLLPIADMATPNRSEAEILAGRRLADEADLVAAARLLGPGEVVVTSANAGGQAITNLLVTGAGVARTTHERLAEAPHGTGDLFAALYLAARLAGRSPAEALAESSGTVLRIVKAAQGEDELPLAAAQNLFLESNEVTQ